MTPLKRAWNSMNSLPSDSLLVASVPTFRVICPSRTWATGTMVCSSTCTVMYGV
ncbi:Uncharacterised protein [Bordetella pertussis]|nr:Uncharacterised protein [Bordetella pertussis]CFO71852.1 Uncharacterised protein [Bordetella pertussis]CFU81745.1 Uncharacterised protein [Bordetella pertussis]CFW05825.1 Uncharacterised protein [Bordetella pertussis]CFW45424.1 Uncharacterised protein [Bordetella pertussis]